MIYSLCAGLPEMGSWADKNKGLVTSSWPWLGTEQPELLYQWCYTSSLHRRFCGGTFIEPQFWRCRVTQRMFIMSSKETKQQFLLLHQTSKKASPGNPVRSVLNRTLSPLGRDSSVKSRAVACYFVVCISMDRCQKKIVWLDKLLLFKLKQIFGFINPIFTWKMPSVHYKASDFRLGKKHCSRPSKGKQSEELNLPGAALMTWV